MQALHLQSTPDMIAEDSLVVGFVTGVKHFDLAELYKSRGNRRGLSRDYVGNRNVLSTPTGMCIVFSNIMLCIS